MNFQGYSVAVVENSGLLIVTQPEEAYLTMHSFRLGRKPSYLDTENKARILVYLYDDADNSLYKFGKSGAIQKTAAKLAEIVGGEASAIGSDLEFKVHNAKKPGSFRELIEELQALPEHYSIISANYAARD